MRILGWTAAVAAGVAFGLALVDAVPNPAALVVWALILTLVAIALLELARAGQERREAERRRRGRAGYVDLSRGRRQ